MILILKNNLKISGNFIKNLIGINNFNTLIFEFVKNSEEILNVRKKKKKNEDKSDKLEELKINDSNKEEEKFDGLIKEDEELEEFSELDKRLGISLIIEWLILEKKPLIGHNIILDILFIYNQFIDDLPENFLKFTEEVKFYYF